MGNVASCRLVTGVESREVSMKQALERLCAALAIAMTATGAVAGDFTLSIAAGESTTFEVRIDIEEASMPRPPSGPAPSECSPAIPTCF
jgi:hypothetical protein